MVTQDHNTSDVPADTTAVADKRGASRFEYEYVQGISPLRGGMPDAGDFFDVVCRDLSQGGFSFYFDAEPDFEELVAALGRQPEITRVRARVVRARPVEYDGSPRYLVGCRFTERLDP